MALAALALFQTLSKQAESNRYTFELTIACEQYTRSQEKVAKYEKLKAKYDKAIDKATNNNKDITINNFTVKAGNMNEAIAEQYANLVVTDYDENIYEVLIDEDTYYANKKTFYETAKTLADEQQKSYKQYLTQACQDNCLLQT